MTAEGGKGADACRMPSQSKFFANWFPNKEAEISLFEEMRVTKHRHMATGKHIPLQNW